jgi:hypothetical protein
MSPCIEMAHAVRMRALTTAKPTPRAADNELYDRGFDLVEAAAAIRRAADAPEAARAIPAVLGCIESAMQELAWASVALEQTSAGILAADARCRPSTRVGAIGERLQRGHANLQQALFDAERASGAARSLASRALTASGAVRDRRGG